jgi:hypothetical protein
MKIRFCDLCNESVPQVHIDGGRAIARCDRLVCANCRAAFQPPVAARHSPKRQHPSQLGLVAVLVSQVVVFAVYAVVVVVALFIVRQRWHWSVDGFLDQIIGTIS